MTPTGREIRKLHQAINVAQRRAGGVVPACDGEGCAVCQALADALAACLAAEGELNPFAGELAIYRRGEWVMGINEPHIDTVLTAIRDALPFDVDSAEGEEEPHDPLCSLGTWAGDQRMPCDCRPPVASPASPEGED
jgi:hypothetical protein